MEALSSEVDAPPTDADNIEDVNIEDVVAEGVVTDEGVADDEESGRLELEGKSTGLLVTAASSV